MLDQDSQPVGWDSKEGCGADDWGSPCSPQRGPGNS